MARKKINQLDPLETPLNGSELFALSIEISPGVFKTYKVNIQQISGTNFANANLTLTGDREHQGNDFNLRLLNFKSFEATSFSGNSGLNVYGGGSAIFYGILSQLDLDTDTENPSVNLNSPIVNILSSVFNIDTEGGTINLSFADMYMNGAGLFLTSLEEYADEAAAILGGLGQNQVYKTPTGELRIKL